MSRSPGGTAASRDLADPAVRAELRARLSRAYADRPVLVGPGLLATLTPAVDLLRAAGASRLLLLPTGRGAGQVTAPGDGVEVVDIEPVPVTSLSEEMRTHDTLLRHLPPSVVARVDAFDPVGEAVWYATPFVTDDEPILGRRVTMGRPAAFMALEDKLLADPIWAAVGVPAAPSRVVAVSLPTLRRATAELAGPDGRGVVWSGDAREGINGAGDYVRWVVTPADEVRAHAFFAPRCDRVRVMPFLDGVPCSVHGVVLPVGTAALRPVELGTLRDPARQRFVFGGLSTCWQPDPVDVEAMRGLVRRVGEHLRTAYDYRGVFGVDGVLTADGFRPTELNSRLSPGAITVLAGVDPALLPLLQGALLAGFDPGLSVADLETVVPAADRAPVARVAVVGGRSSVREVESFPIELRGGRLERSSEPTGSELMLSPTASGFYASIHPCALVPPGGRIAGLEVALTAFLDREYAAGLGPLQAAPSVR